MEKQLKLLAQIILPTLLIILKNKKKTKKPAIKLNFLFEKVYLDFSERYKLRNEIMLHFLNCNIFCNIFKKCNIFSIGISGYLISNSFPQFLEHHPFEEKIAIYMFDWMLN